MRGIPRAVLHSREGRRCQWSVAHTLTPCAKAAFCVFPLQFLSVLSTNRLLAHMATTILPLELIDKCIGQRIHVIMKQDKEFVGTLLGFDDFISTPAS
jgi:hypothetical protein